jgi:hypothetical protein
MFYGIVRSRSSVHPGCYLDAEILPQMDKWQYKGAQRLTVIAMGL